MLLFVAVGFVCALLLFGVCCGRFLPSYVFAVVVFLLFVVARVVPSLFVAVCCLLSLLVVVGAGASCLSLFADRCCLLLRVDDVIDVVDNCCSGYC